MSAMLHGCLADTEFLEVASRSGHRFGVWVNTPQMDPYLSVAPCIQVRVGYAGDEASEWSRHAPTPREP